jgi:TDG/mug DNA glycosylase family protein
MPHIQGFPPISRPDAGTLILGSMPSRESLLQRRYYAHPRNSFWPIISELFGIMTLDYAQRAECLTRKGIAIWDVLQACFRSSSLDSDIDDSTIVTNDFETFYRNHSRINRVFFNGAKAESVYRRHVLPGLPTDLAAIQLQRLPSTSPANAGMTAAEKQQAWKVILK